MKTIIKKHIIKNLCKLICLAVILAGNSQLRAQESGGVLVAAEESTIKQVSIIEIRRIYLGLPATSDGMINQPVINVSDYKTYKIFLKNVMHMTESGYQRKTVKRIFRQGGKKLKEAKSKEQLVKYLKDDPLNVSFMKKEDAEKTEGIKVVQVLW